MIKNVKNIKSFAMTVELDDGTKATMKFDMDGPLFRIQQYTDDELVQTETHPLLVTVMEYAAEAAESAITLLLTKDEFVQASKLSRQVLDSMTGATHSVGN
jgi:hypothetical protein